MWPAAFALRQRSRAAATAVVVAVEHVAGSAGTAPLVARPRRRRPRPAGGAVRVLVLGRSARSAARSGCRRAPRRAAGSSRRHRSRARRSSCSTRSSEPAHDDDPVAAPPGRARGARQRVLERRALAGGRSGSPPSRAAQPLVVLGHEAVEQAHAEAGGALRARSALSFFAQAMPAMSRCAHGTSLTKRCRNSARGDRAAGAAAGDVLHVGDVAVDPLVVGVGQRHAPQLLAGRLARGRRAARPARRCWRTGRRSRARAR